jgi:hypothetical protein
MAEEADTPQTSIEAQGEAEAKKTTPVAEKAETAPEAIPDEWAPKKDEDLAAYAARMRNEISWRDKQIGRQHRQKKEADERQSKYAEIEAENQRLKELAEAGKREQQGQTPPQRPQVPQPQPAGLDANTMAKARIQVGMERLAEQLGREKDWSTASTNFEKAGGIPEAVIRDILATDDPKHVILALGRDMNRYQQILDMGEDRRRAILFKMGMEPGEKAEAPKPIPRPSAAPSPREGLPTGSAVPSEGEIDLYDPKYAGSDHDDAWFRKRIEQKRNSQGRPWSVGGRSGGR